jgi:hypothetical protein
MKKPPIGGGAALARGFEGCRLSVVGSFTAASPTIVTMPAGARPLPVEARKITAKISANRLLFAHEVVM